MQTPSLQSIDWLNETRAHAATLAAHLPIPQMRYGLGIFFSVKDHGIKALPQSADENDIHVAVSAKNGNVTVLDFESALQNEQLAGLIRARLHPTLFSDAFDAWRAAFASGTLIHVSEGAEADITLTVPSQGASADNAIIVCEADSKVRITETSAGAVDGIRIGHTDIVALDRADVRFVSFSERGDTSKEIVRRFASVADDATMTWIDAMFGGSFIQGHTRTALVGPKAKAFHRNAFLTAGHDRVDLQHIVIHAADGTETDIISRGAIAESSKVAYRGVINMEKGIQAALGNQKENVLILSPDAEIAAMPDLEIATNDVQCRHSASIGRLDEEKLFYLRSRGIEEQHAKRMAARGFFSPIIAAAGDTGPIIEEALERRIQTLYPHTL